MRIFTRCLPHFLQGLPDANVAHYVQERAFTCRDQRCAIAFLEQARSRSALEALIERTGLEATARSTAMPES